MNVYVVSHSKYAYLGVAALPASLFTEVIPELRHYHDDGDATWRLARSVSVTRQEPDTADATAHCETWLLGDEAAAEFDRVWSANEALTRPAEVRESGTEDREGQQR